MDKNTRNHCHEGTIKEINVIILSTKNACGDFLSEYFNIEGGEILLSSSDNTISCKSGNINFHLLKMPINPNDTLNGLSEIISNNTHIDALIIPPPSTGGKDEALYGAKLMQQENHGVPLYFIGNYSPDQFNETKATFEKNIQKGADFIKNILQYTNRGASPCQ